ncbi:MAG: tRNA-specific 2-thiouridylase [Nitrospirae bacterium]|nr:tRNA-specific 2-thiouridylase [Nitrospirota bacterium]
MKVIVAMSGGVDSSVAAYLLKKEGHEVIGLSFELWDKRDLKSSNVCCSVETIELAKSVAHKIGIEHYTVDVRDAFYSYVIESFCDSYIKGITPNPCILCNKHIKFDFLLKKAEELGADLVATGHYARIVRQKTEVRSQNTDVETSRRLVSTDSGHSSFAVLRRTEAGMTDKERSDRYLLKKGIDPRKDQSYVLYVLTQAQLAKTVFPLGVFTKDMTRGIARELDLATALRPESQEICFVGEGKYADFLKGFSPEALQPGRIIDMSGKTVGEHKGIAFYTIGQRKRLGISSLNPHYVVSIDRKNNIIVVGSKEDAMKKRFRVRELNWLSIDSPADTLRAHVKIRSTMKEMPAAINPAGENSVVVEFDEPQWAPAPGQSAVFYEKDVVIGGGLIE